MQPDLHDQNESGRRQGMGLFDRRLLRGVLAVVAFAALLLWCADHTQNLSRFLTWLADVFSPILLGLGIAFAVNAILCPIERLWIRTSGLGEKKPRLRRGICLLLSVLLVLGVVCAVAFVILPQLSQTVERFVQQFTKFLPEAEKLWEQIVSLAEDYGVTLPQIEPEKIEKALQNLLSDYGNRLLRFSADLVSGVIDTALAVVFAIYVLAQKEMLARQCKKLLYALFSENRTQKILRFSRLVNQTFANFVTGQLTEAVIIGVLCFICMMLFDMPYAPAISVLIGFSALIPVFGAFFGTAIGAFLILSVDLMQAVWFVVFIIVLQQLEGNLIYPRVMGKSIGLPGIWVLAAVTIGGAAFGIVGMLIGVPLCSVLYCLLRNFVDGRVRDKRLSPTLWTQREETDGALH